MNLRNKVTLIGNLGADPELKDTENGHKKLAIRLATNEPYKNKDGAWVPRTNWHRLIAWDLQAENMHKFLHKGTEIVAEGRLVTRDYEKDGEKRYITEVQVDSFLVLDKKEKDKEKEKESSKAS